MRLVSRPHFLIRKYYTLMRASLAVEGSAFLVSLTDALVAGNNISSDALAAVALITPFTFLITFIAVVINAGTTIRFSFYMGKYDKKHANEVFSQGAMFAVASGLLTILGLWLIKEPFIRYYVANEALQQYVRDYLSIYLFCLGMSPLSILMDNIVMSDGGERLSAFANVVEIIGKVALSFILSERMGIAGIALASVLCKVTFLLIIHCWRLSDRCNLSYRWYFNFREFGFALQNGLVKALPIIFRTVTSFAVNSFVLKHYSVGTLTILSVVQSMDAFAFFTGLSQAAGPLIGTLRGEENSKQLRELMRSATNMLFFEGCLYSIFVIVFAGQIIRAYGITDPALIEQGIQVIRIIGISYVFNALSIHFFIYFNYIEKRLICLGITLVKDIAAPVGALLLLSLFSGSEMVIWTALTVPPIISFAWIMCLVIIKYKKELFPFLIPYDQFDRIFIYNIDLTDEEITRVSEDIGTMLEEHGYPRRMIIKAGVLVEDLLCLVKEKNPPKMRVSAECVVILTESGARIIVRDSGKLFNSANEDAAVTSLTQYVVSAIMGSIGNKGYLMTTGYNRTEVTISSADY